MPKTARIVTLTLLALLLPAVAAGQTKLLRFPDIHDDEVVFCYGGDLWKAPADGGLASRLTAHPGQELFPHFSPDGRWIAFTGQYDGDEQVYVMPATGGIPRQLTYYPAQGPLPPRWGYDHQVYGFSPDGRNVLFRSLRDADGIRVETALYTVPVEGGLPQKLPMPTSGAGDFSPDGGRLAYSPLFRDFRTWKRYQGGWAQDLYIFDLETHETTPIAPSPRTERDPMWIGERIFFASDRDGTLNLYSYDLASGEIARHTNSETWDVRWPGTDNRRRIVYELDGELQVYDLESGTDRRIAIEVPDDGLSMRPSRYSAADHVEDFELSPRGERALFVARGDVFTVPIEKGPTRNLTNTSNAHERFARWSPDGSRIAFISDVDGEEQVWVVDQDGSGEPQQLTRGFTGQLYAPEWSPDGKRIAFSDKDGKVRVLTVADREVVEVADEARGRVLHYAWSPHGGHLAFALSDPNQLSSIWIWSVADGETRRVTGEMFDEFEPVWDPDGDYLYFLSRRQFAPQISMLEWNFAGNRQVGIFALALRKDVPHLLPPQSDEVTIGEDDTNKEEDDGDETGDEPEHVRIDFDGLAQRVSRVSVAADNLTGLAVTDEFVFYVAYGAPFYGRDSYSPSTLHVFDLDERKASALATDIEGYAISADGSKLLVLREDAYRLLDAKPDAKIDDAKTVSTSGLMVDRVPKQEWAQIFDEVWRRFRDWFYVENMHGYDWEAIGERYRALVPFVAHRSDLNYVIGEMIAELNVGHAYIEGGDFEIPERPRVGLPGARFELDETSGRYRIARILRGQNEEPRYRSPLTEVGVEAAEGDYVLAIDGEPLEAPDNPYRLLQHKTDPVTLTVNGTPTTEGARQVTYEPITDEQPLLYLEMVRHNLDEVARATDGRVGYLHLPNMGASGIYEFIKWFYPQIRREGLVIDVRANGGGNVSQWIIERLDSKLLGTRFGANSDEPATYPYTVFHGHMACLISETSASDGDIFPYRFRQSGLGPLIGKRTWGGVVGISGRGPLLDGGTVYVPLAGTNAPDGSWIIEGHGVDPDIEVENDPASVIAGRDPQLERAIEEVMKRIEEEPRRLPERPADPVKIE